MIPHEYHTKKISCHNGMGLVFNSTCGHASTQFTKRIASKHPKLQLKTQLRKLLGSLPLAFAPYTNLTLQYPKSDTDVDY